MEKVKNGSPKTGRPLPFQEIYISTQRKPKWAANHKISISWQNGLNRNHQPIIGLLNVEYYSQRASEGGFRLTEATPISRHAVGYPGLPGIFSPSQIAGWKKDNDVVHAKGGYMYCQLWHVSRATVFSFIEGKDFLGASDTPISGNALDESEYAASPPRAMTVQEIQDTMHEYAAAAKRAREAGFDGVEVHRAKVTSLTNSSTTTSTPVPTNAVSKDFGDRHTAIQ